MEASRVLLITGEPGAGKTTFVRRLAGALPGVRIGGFLTEEIREHGRRTGFRLLPFDGPAHVLAHVDFELVPLVGRYGVDVTIVDRAAEGLDPARDVDLWIIDEIGRMECLSSSFVAAVRRLIDGGAPMVATVARRGTGLIADLGRSRAERLELTPENRDALLSDALAWLERLLHHQ